MQRTLVSLSYTVRESLSCFTRAKLSTFISIVTITISLLFLGVFAVISVHASRFIDALRDKVELEAFLDEPMSFQEISELQQQVSSLPGVEGLTLVSKDDAAKTFQEEFGENILDVLEFNPLPASIKISLQSGFKTSEKAAAISAVIEQMRGIESVRYRKDLLELIDTRAASVNNLTLGLGVFVSLSAIFLVSNTIRLAIHAKRHLIRTMELVGATGAFIRVPFLLEGLIQGFLGGIVATALLYGLLEYATRFTSFEFTGSVHMEPIFYAGVLAAGLFLGFVGAIISVFRFIAAAATP